LRDNPPKFCENLGGQENKFMPADFEKCVKEGGKVRTIPIKGHKDEYLHICYDKNGKSHAGEVKTKKK